MATTSGLRRLKIHRLMPNSVEHKTVQARILEYAKVDGALLGHFRYLQIYGNREFVEHLRNRGKFFDHEEKRERDLILFDRNEQEDQML